LLTTGRYIEHPSVGELTFVQVATTALLAGFCRFRQTSLGGAALGLDDETDFAVLITSIGSTVIAFSFQVWAQQYTSPTHTAILISLEPVFATLTSWLLAREHLGGRIPLGASLIFAGIVLAELKGPARAAPESAEPVTRIRRVRRMLN
jgi:drug/metabolite transporter (DMT)-like permease